MTIRTEANVVTVKNQVITIPSEEYRRVNRISTAMLGFGAFLMAFTITYNHFVGNINRSVGLYFLLIFALTFGFLLIYGSTWVKNHMRRKIALKNGWDGKCKFVIKPDNEQRFLHE